MYWDSDGGEWYVAKVKKASRGGGATLWYPKSEEEEVLDADDLNELIREGKILRESGQPIHAQQPEMQRAPQGRPGGLAPGAQQQQHGWPQAGAQPPQWGRAGPAAGDLAGMLGEGPVGLPLPTAVGAVGSRGPPPQGFM